MLIKQLSVFLENRLGRFSQIAKIFSEAGINMKAFTVSENAEFGVLHLIVSDPEKACSLLREKSFAATLNEVICSYPQYSPSASTLRRILWIRAFAY